MSRWLGALLVPLFLSFAALAGPIVDSEIPKPLAPWKDWVLHDQKDHACPMFFASHKLRECAWPGELSLDLSDQTGTFEQEWQVYAPTWIQLPGNGKNWPQNVMLNKRSAVVGERSGRPGIELAPGKHHIQGNFFWKQLPESLPVSPMTGIVRVKIQGEMVAFPERDEVGNLWLRKKDTGIDANAGLQNRLTFQVYRKISDDIPLQVETRIELQVAGSQREETLGTALLKDFIPVSLDSALPVRLEIDGSLRVQVRPGQWHINLIARNSGGQIIDLASEKQAQPWPVEEVWAFEPQNHLRLVEVEGVQTVDPRQTNMPREWQHLPTYRMTPADTMHFKVLRRGDPEPAPNQLSLKRTLWLDFKGTGYTAHDEITGSMTSGWRLEASQNLKLGQVMVDGEPQFITQHGEKDQQGVEVRRGALQVSADSRFEGDIASMSVAGWNHDFQHVSATLNLPPGWKLFSVSGADNVPYSWIARWTLLDIFLVLIIAISTARLFTWGWGLLALVTVTLVWHESLAPQFIWLNLMAAIALLRVLPMGKVKRMVFFYQGVSLLALVLIVIPFSVDQVRKGIYPQLERPWPQVVQTQWQDGGMGEPMLERAPMSSVGQVADAYSRSKAMEMAPQKGKLLDEEGRYRKLDQLDANAVVQTGPGLPQWQWKSIPLTWNGPVDHRQEFSMVLMSPVLTSIFRFLSVLFVVLYGYRVIRTTVPSIGHIKEMAGGTAALLLAGVALSGNPDLAMASEFPSQPLLQELKSRLVLPPDCMPNCAQVSRMKTVIKPDMLTARVEIHVQTASYAPLPGNARHWQPSQVLIDGKVPSGVLQDAKGVLYAYFEPGIHNITVHGKLPLQSQVQILLPLVPHKMEIDADGWSVEGVDQNGRVEGQIQLVRVMTKETPDTEMEQLEVGSLPLFVRVERNLQMGIDWEVVTTVVRASPGGSAIVMEIPLLEGESVITEHIRVEEGKVFVNMPASANRMTWRSVLAKTDKIHLQAPEVLNWVEVWRLNSGLMWHMDLSGLPVVHHKNRNDRWLPEWRPWPGEEVLIDVSRPAGVEGRSLTIDDSSRVIKPGKRATDTTLTLTVRSSQGTQHTLKLPEQAELQNVLINKVAQPIRQEGNEVNLPITPGKQTVSLTWREQHPVQTYFKTPDVDLGIDSVNSTTNIQLGQDRWVLLLGGPILGPAVLFWGVLAVIVAISIGLGRTSITPLKTWHWLLLGIGLSQTDPASAMVVVLWLFALGWREKHLHAEKAPIFNLVQIMLLCLTLIALANLFAAIQRGLLGYPQMQIIGNQSSAYNLSWYQDRTGEVLPSSWVISVPLAVYRGLMLAWALWLAFTLLRWLRWGWECYSKGGIWQPVDWKSHAKKDRSQEENATPEEVKQLESPEDKVE